MMPNVPRLIWYNVKTDPNPVRASPSESHHLADVLGQPNTIFFPAHEPSGGIHALKVHHGSDNGCPCRNKLERGEVFKVIRIHFFQILINNLNDSY